MNSSIKFILNHILKLKFVLLSYGITIILTLFGSLAFQALKIEENIFPQLLVSTATLAPFIIMIIAVLQFFSFRSDISYAKFLSTIPFTKKKQLLLIWTSLFVLVFAFSLILLSISFMYAFDETQSLKLQNVLIYFTFLLFTTSLLGLFKILLIHNRSFFIALFFTFIGSFSITAIPSYYFSRFYHVQLPGECFFSLLFLIGTCISIVLSSYFYLKEIKSNNSFKTQKIATGIIYTFLLIPILFLLYKNTPLPICIVLVLILFGFAIGILKATLNKIPIWTLLTPFIIANIVTIPSIQIESYLQDQHLLSEWKTLHFKEEKDINLSIASIELFGKKRDIVIFPNTLNGTRLLDSLYTNANITLHSQDVNSLKDNYISGVNSRKLISITWKSTESKEQFAIALEELLTEINKEPLFNTQASFTDSNKTPCTLLENIEPFCSQSTIPFSLPSTGISVKDVLKKLDSFEKFENGYSFSGYIGLRENSKYVFTIRN